jgi:hypothetical protein
VAGAVHRACWRSCCARGRRLARGCLSCGKGSTQGLLEELQRKWSLQEEKKAAIAKADMTAFLAFHHVHSAIHWILFTFDSGIQTCYITEEFGG